MKKLVQCTLLTIGLIAETGCERKQPSAIPQKTQQQANVCKRCDGHGTVFVTKTNEMPCPICDGKGIIGKD